MLNFVIAIDKIPLIIHVLLLYPTLIFLLFIKDFNFQIFLHQIFPLAYYI